MHLALHANQTIHNKLAHKLVGVEQARIKKHLTHTLQRLQKADVSSIPAAHQPARARTLRQLDDYIAQGDFPQNTHLSGRHPIFVDDSGNYCAVGYLLHRAGYDEYVDDIRQNHNDIRIDDITDARYLNAISALGITKEEAAQIQPGYGFIQPEPSSPPLLGLFALSLYTVAQIFLLLFITRLNISNSQKRLLVFAYVFGNTAVACLIALLYMNEIM